MSKFDTHGGYFAPLGYMKVNEGGSHEENPNGGVQVGVDPEGVPNLLEEGEPVFKDFVFSDNIKAKEKFLKQFGIPEKYAGKLYSEIADSFLSEAELRPNDEISANGLNAMLGRLAEAQEAQKAEEEEKALMEELKNMSPEELAMLEQALAQEQMPQEQMMPEEQMQPETAPEMVAPEQVAPEQVAPEMPVMACGGKMNKYEAGGPKERKTQQMFDNVTNTMLRNYDALDNAIDNASLGALGIDDKPLVDEHPGLDIALMAAQPGGIVTKAFAPSAYKGLVNGLVSGEGADAFLQGIIPAKVKIPTSGKIVKGLEQEAARVARQAKAAAANTKINTKLLGTKEGLEAEANSALKKSQGYQGKAARQINYGAKLNDELASKRTALEEAYKSGNGEALEQAAKKYDDIVEKISTNEETIRGYSKKSRKLNNEYNRANRRIGMLESSGSGYAGLEPGSKGDDVLHFLADPAYLWNRDAALRSAAKEAGRKGELWGRRAAAVGQSALAGGVDAGIINYGLIKPITEWTGIARTKNAAKRDEVIDDRVSNIKARGGLMNMYPRGTDSLRRSPFWYPQSKTTWEFNPDWSTGRYLYADYDAPYGYIPAPMGPTMLDEAYVTPTQNGIMLDPVYVSNGPGFIVTASRSSNPSSTTKKSGSAFSAQNISVPVPEISDTALGEILNTPNPDLAIDAALPQINDTNISVPELSEGLLKKAKWDRIKGKLNGFDTRLLSPLTDVAMGFANLATPADHYDYTPIRPYLPSGRIALQDQRYMPIDMNMITNQMQAQNTANARAILNSGAGPSTGALINAADYTGGIALGNALANIWQANNQERNRVIAANNQNAATIAQFDRDLDAERAQILNNMAMYNNQNALRIAMLNNQAEQDKYNAVAASINSGKKFLNDYGWEMMNRNMVNSNRGLLGYGIDRMNNVVYDRNGNPILLARCGGKINKKK